MHQPINRQEKARPGEGAGETAAREVFARKHAEAEEQWRISGRNLIAQVIGQAIVGMRVNVWPQLMRLDGKIHRFTYRQHRIGRHLAAAAPLGYTRLHAADQ